MLTRCLDDIDPHEPNIVQRYLHKPHLLDGRKYDLRLYVLQSSIKPLRLYLFREGLVRVCTSKYACKPSNYNELTMHLTNYAINKESDDFVQPSGIEDDEANKLTVTTLMARLAAEGADVDALWGAIGELVVKTMVSVQPHLEHTYYTARQRSDDVGYSCFELLGFDVLFDHKLRPYLLEVNHSPSFTCDSPLDSLVKASVLKGTMEMVSFGRDELKILKRCGTRLDPPTRERLCQLRNAYENARAEPSGFERIYPPSGPSAERAAELLARYDSYLDLAAELYQSQSLAGSRRTGGTQISGGGTHRRVAVPSWGPPPPAPVAAPAAAPPRAAPASAPASTTAAPSKPAASTAPPSSFAAAAAAVRRASPRRPVAAARVFAAPAAAAPYKYADGLLSRAPAPAAAPPGHMHVPTRRGGAAAGAGGASREALHAARRAEGAAPPPPAVARDGARAHRRSHRPLERTAARQRRRRSSDAAARGSAPPPHAARRRRRRSLLVRRPRCRLESRAQQPGGKHGARADDKGPHACERPVVPPRPTGRRVAPRPYVGIAYNFYLDFLDSATTSSTPSTTGPAPTRAGGGAASSSESSMTGAAGGKTSARARRRRRRRTPPPTPRARARRRRRRRAARRRASRARG